MAASAVRTLTARVIGAVVMAGAAFALFFLVILAGGYGFLVYALPVCAYLFVLVVMGMATLLGQPWARFTLSILMPLQACGLVIYVIHKTPRPGQACDFSCYAMPLETIALPVALSLVAAWVVYPGRIRSDT